jgi:hypothetical protein
LTGFGGSRTRRAAALFSVIVLVALVGCTKGRTAQAGGAGVRAYDVFAQNFRFHNMPPTLPSGNIQINFTNRESFPIVHEMILLQMPAGKTVTDLIASAKVPGCAGGADCENQYLHFGEIPDVSTEATRSQVFNLPAGNYFFACWQQGTTSSPDGTPADPTHLSIGMVFTFTVA